MFLNPMLFDSSEFISPLSERSSNFGHPVFFLKSNKNFPEMEHPYKFNSFNSGCFPLSILLNIASETLEPLIKTKVLIHSFWRRGKSNLSSMFVALTTYWFVTMMRSYSFLHLARKMLKELWFKSNLAFIYIGIFSDSRVSSEKCTQRLFQSFCNCSSTSFPKQKFRIWRKV